MPKVDLSMLTWMIPPVPSFSAALAYQQTCNKNSAVCSYLGKSCKGTVVNKSQSKTAAFGAYLSTIPVVRSSKRLPAVEFFCLLQLYFCTIPVPVQVPTYSNDAVRVLDSKVGICSPEKRQIIKSLKTITETHGSLLNAVGALTHAFPTCAWTADRARRRCPYHGTGSKYCRRKHMVVM